MKSLASISSSAGVVIGIVPAGWLADRIGRKRVMIGGTIAYSVLTFATGFAPGIGAMIALRVLAGIAMGAVFPLPYAYGGRTVPARRPRPVHRHRRHVPVRRLLPVPAAGAVADPVRRTAAAGGSCSSSAASRSCSPPWPGSSCPSRRAGPRPRGGSTRRSAVLGEIEARVEAERGEPLPPPSPVPRRPGRAAPADPGRHAWPCCAPRSAGCSSSSTRSRRSCRPW